MAEGPENVQQEAAKAQTQTRLIARKIGVDGKFTGEERDSGWQDTPAEDNERIANLLITQHVLPKKKEGDA